MNHSADIIIIGAGIAGTSAAAALSEHRHVVTLEQEATPGYHSTGRSAATWAPFYGPDVIQQLTAMSKPLLSNPSADFADNPFTSAKGELMLGAAEDADEIDKHLQLGMQQITLNDARALVPLIRADKVNTCLYTENMLDIDVDALHQSFLKHSKRNGSELICNAAVSAMQYRNTQWTVETSKGLWHADLVINAAGAWADQVAKMAGVKPLGIQPKKRTAALLPYLEGSNMENWPMVFGAGESFYCTPFGNGLMVSPADETHVDAHDAWPDELDIATGIDEFQQHIDYPVERVMHQWAGLRSFAPDGDPVVGFDKELPNFFWLAGQGGYGIQTSPAIAALCATIILGIESPMAQLVDEKNLIKVLSPSRF